MKTHPLHISRKWMMTKHSCGINECGHRCCTSDAFRTHYTKAEVKKYRCALDLPVIDCGFPRDECMGMPIIDRKPIVCILYPFRVRSGALVLHHTIKNVCRGCYGIGDPAYIHFKEQLVHVFGQEVYDNISFWLEYNNEVMFYVDIPLETARMIGMFDGDEERQTTFGEME